jgi:hypothetical protein
MKTIDLVNYRGGRMVLASLTKELPMFVVTGVTGNTGSVVASTLLAAGKPVRVVVRDAKKG